MLAKRRASGWADRDALAPHPHHRPVHLLGRSRRAGAGGRRGRGGDHRHRPHAAQGGAGPHRVRAGRRPPHPDPPHRPGRRDRHRRRHAPGHRLDHHLGAQDAREQRDRDDEHPGQLHRARHDRAQGRLPLLGAVLRLRAGRPGVLHRGPAPQAQPAVAAGARHRRGRVGGRRLRGQAPADDRLGAALRPRPGARHAHVAGAAAGAAGRPDDPRLRPAPAVRARGRRRRGADARGDRGPARHLQRRRRRRARPQRGRGPARQAGGAPAAAVGDEPGAADRPPPRRAHPARPAQRAALRPGAGQPSLQGDGLPAGPHQPRDGRAAARAPADRAADARPPGSLPLRARGRGLPALEPERPARHRRRWRPSREQITELRRALDALERGEAPASPQPDCVPLAAVAIGSPPYLSCGTGCAARS